MERRQATTGYVRRQYFLLFMINITLVIFSAYFLLLIINLK
jgi:hypothetical protein